MSRFVSPDLSRLPAPSALEALDFEALVAARLATLVERAEARSFPFDVETLESDPLVVDQQTRAVHELTVRSRVNDAVRAVLLVTATGAQLDHIAATYYGISRLVLTPATGNTPAVMEADADFRVRIALAVEAWSTAGPEGAYIFHALEADGTVLDVAVYSEEDGALYSDDTPVLAPEVLVIVLSRVGNGAASSELLARVLTDLSAREVRPIGDKVVVEPATILPYAVSATLKVRAGADASLLVAEARSRVEAYVTTRRRVGAIVQRLGLGAALKVTDVEEIVLSSPAADVDPGSKGAGYCTAITITAEAAEDSWR
jgi:phage-related baseplate assembly protein